jgi:hypothetical protein
MAYPHSLRIEGLLAKIESGGYGVDPTPTAADDGIRGVGRIWNALGPEWAFSNMREETVSNSLISVAPGAPKGRVVTITYTVQLMGAGAAYASGTPVRPECDALLMACGFARTHTDTGDSESVDYDLADTGHASVTVWAYAAGKLFKIVGCRGNMTWSPSAGGLGEISFTLQGLLTVTPSETATPTITYDAVVPPPAVSMGLAVVPAAGSWTPRTAGLEVTTGHAISRLDDVSSADGIEEFALARTEPTLGFQARAVDLSTYSPWTLAASRAVQTIDMTLGSTQYNRVKLDCDLAYLSSDPTPADDQGFAAYQLNYQLRDLQLTFD